PRAASGAGVKAFPQTLVDADDRSGAGLMEARVIVITSCLVKAHRHVEPRADPLAGVDGTGLECWHDLRARQSHNNCAQPSENLGTEPRHSVAQPLEPLRRIDL